MFLYLQVMWMEMENEKYVFNIMWDEFDRGEWDWR